MPFVLPSQTKGTLDFMSIEVEEQGYIFTPIILLMNWSWCGGLQCGYYFSIVWLGQPQQEV